MKKEVNLARRTTHFEPDAYNDAYCFPPVHLIFHNSRRVKCFLLFWYSKKGFFENIIFHLNLIQGSAIFAIGSWNWNQVILTNLKSHENSLALNLDTFPPKPTENICVMSEKICTSSPDLKKSMMAMWTTLLNFTTNVQLMRRQSCVKILQSSWKRRKKNRERG